MQEPSLDHSRQAKTNGITTRQPRTAFWKKLGAVGGSGRPTADLARGPHRLIQATWRLLIGPLGRLQGSHLVTPCYKYNGGVEIMTHTHTHHTSSPVLCLALLA